MEDWKRESLNEAFAKVVAEHGETLMKLAEHERIERERFEQGLDSGYCPTDGTYCNDCNCDLYNVMEDDANEDD